ncbi:MAG: aminomethyl-transferring glycine dehydrogenase subunit GcvPB [Planctomycetota bacterium]|jgi:glycine dehydrogenase subunit 2
MIETLFEISQPGRRGYRLPAPDVPEADPARELGGLVRESETVLPELSELDVVRHYSALAARNIGVDTNFYPLGSCTMKYNPKITERLAADPRFTGLHPEMTAECGQGTLAILHETERMLSEICGMHEFTLWPAAGAHGELTGMMIIKAHHCARGACRKKVIVPDSSHGTNPASAALCGYDVVTVKSAHDGQVDLAALKKAMDRETAALMLTNPNTLGLFETRIREVARVVHRKGGLVYYDGANLNAIMGVTRPGDMGFDVVHVNLHKTFSTPHGGGGPGSGPVGVTRKLARYLPVPRIKKRGRKFALKGDAPDSIGPAAAYTGNVGVVLRAWGYMRMLGAEGVRRVAEYAVLNARYLLSRLRGPYKLAYEEPPMHEFVLEGLARPGEVRTLDVAKRLIDLGMHPPTVYFPLIVSEALMVEPTETESKQTLDLAAEKFLQVAREAQAEPETVRSAPKTTPVGRLDEVTAARKPRLVWKPEEPGTTDEHR